MLIQVPSIRNGTEADVEPPVARVRIGAWLGLEVRIGVRPRFGADRGLLPHSLLSRERTTIEFGSRTIRASIPLIAFSRDQVLT